ncbi:hypothetical protein ACJX0J_035971 [Zea mays]
MNLIVFLCLSKYQQNMLMHMHGCACWEDEYVEAIISCGQDDLAVEKIGIALTEVTMTDLLAVDEGDDPILSLESDSTDDLVNNHQLAIQFLIYFIVGFFHFLHIFHPYWSFVASHGMRTWAKLWINLVLLTCFVPRAAVAVATQWGWQQKGQEAFLRWFIYHYLYILVFCILNLFKPRFLRNLKVTRAWFLQMEEGGVKKSNILHA